VLEIVHFPHPALRYQSRPITEIDNDLRATIRAMFDLMYAARGIGLAANQVALPFRFFILNTTADPEQRDKELVFINPAIVKRHSSIEDEEGCLSLPGLYANVRRAKKVRVRAYDLDGNLVEHEADELMSRAVQHETDHLDGKLFIDYLEPMERHSHAEKLRNFELVFRKAQESGTIPNDADILRWLDALPRPTFDNDSAPGKPETT
jgi:peptide deformylase